MNYTTEKNTQILIALMKEHGIKKVIVSPGATNVSFVASIQNDSFFEIYSSVDERSAAYIACGLAEESGEPVAISCTGATASRNYVSGLTEAYYRKLPVLAITSTMPLGRIGHNYPQVIDRTNIFNDIAKLSVQIPEVHDEEDEWSCTVGINKAILELTRDGGGPVHINLVTKQKGEFTVTKLPEVRTIKRLTYKDEFPPITEKNVTVFVGAHRKWTDEETKELDLFCEKYNGVVFCDQTSNYQGKYKILASLITSQKQFFSQYKKMGLMIHIGNTSGAYIDIIPEMVWRVNSDGEVRDTFRKLGYVFEMDEITFFKKYNNLQSQKNENNTFYYCQCKQQYDEMINRIPELPFSNIWIAQHTSGRLPENSVVHFGILNSLRSWNFFEIPRNIMGYSNTGGFGIDGCVSTLLGASLADKDKLFFGFVGDLAYFYDMNVIGNRHFGKNIRLLVVNNGHGQEFTNYSHRAQQFGDKTDKYIAAAGHFGNKSKTLVKNYAQNLGMDYICADSKEEYETQLPFFLSKDNSKSIIFEVFTNSEHESEALKIMYNLIQDSSFSIKKAAKNLLGDTSISGLKKLFKG